MKMKFQIQEITDGMKPYFNMGCLDIATEMSLAEQTGLAVMAISVMHEQTGLSKNELEDIMITNGTKTFICRRNDAGFVFIDKVPVYDEMLCQQQ